MTEKIEWYREVLELEPNSKVFFPLARLLAGDGQPEEAMRVLEQGLKRHPEFLEARLYFIELLYRHGEQALCQEQIGELSRMFASYAGFWDAWAACLSQKKEDADTASILRFLAANFISGPLQLHDVIDRGLASVIREAREGREAAGSAPRPDAADSEREGVAPAEREPVAELPADEPALPEAAPEPEQAPAGLVEADAPEAAEAALELAEVAAAENTDDELTLEDEFIAAAETDMPAESAAIQTQAPPEDISLEAVFDDMLDDLAGQSQELAGMGAIVPEPLADVPEPEMDAAIEAAGDEITADDAPVSGAETTPPESALAGADAAPETEEETFSLRTRSMAEVLAEQDDIPGALDIYRELVRNATDPNEIDDINHRIATLSGRMGQAAPEFAAPATDDRTSSKEKLIGMLEALAQRVEARAQN